LGIPIEEISTIIIHGAATGKTEVLSKEISIDILLGDDGAAHGLFRLKNESTKIVQFGSFKNGKVNGFCWIVSPTNVNNCFGILEVLTPYFLKPSFYDLDC
jgi:hypothetical protein